MSKTYTELFRGLSDALEAIRSASSTADLLTSEGLCPHCGEDGNVIELDYHLAENETEAGGDEGLGVMQADTLRETLTYACLTCDRPVAPGPDTPVDWH
jgi:hypothetical protein